MSYRSSNAPCHCSTLWASCFTLRTDPALLQYFICHPCFFRSNVRLFFSVLCPSCRSFLFCAPLHRLPRCPGIHRHATALRGTRDEHPPCPLSEALLRLERPRKDPSMKPERCVGFVASFTTQQDLDLKVELRILVCLFSRFHAFADH